MGKIKRIIALLCLFALLCGCTNKNYVSSNIDILTTTSTPVSSDTTPVSSEPEIEYDDLLLSMTDCGREVVGYGDLKNDDYNDALSELETVLDAYSRDISVVAYSLDNKKALAYNTQTRMFCACTVKAPFTLYCCLEMEKGNGSLDTKMVYNKEHYETGTGTMQYSSFGTTFDMRTILGKSMSISDNVGYMMSVDYFGRDGYNKWIESLGCESLKIKPTVWSLRAKARELAVAWRKIYNYFGTETDCSKFLYDSCTNTPDNYATAALKGVDYSHKQGHNWSDGWNAYSDAGIVWKEGNPYIIVILTNAPGPSSYDAKMMADTIKIIDSKLF